LEFPLKVTNKLNSSTHKHAHLTNILYSCVLDVTGTNTSLFYKLDIDTSAIYELGNSMWTDIGSLSVDSPNVLIVSHPVDVFASHFVLLLFIV